MGLSDSAFQSPPLQAGTRTDATANSSPALNQVSPGIPAPPFASGSATSQEKFKFGRGLRTIQEVWCEKHLYEDYLARSELASSSISGPQPKNRRISAGIDRYEKDYFSWYRKVWTAVEDCASEFSKLDPSLSESRLQVLAIRHIEATMVQWGMPLSLFLRKKTRTIPTPTEVPVD